MLIAWSNPGSSQTQNRGVWGVSPFPGGAPWEETWRVVRSFCLAQWRITGTQRRRTALRHLHHLENPPEAQIAAWRISAPSHSTTRITLGISFVICKRGRRLISVQMTLLPHWEDFMNSNCHDSFLKCAGSARMRFHGVGKVPTCPSTCCAHGGEICCGDRCTSSQTTPRSLRCPVSTSWLESERNN